MRIIGNHGRNARNRGRKGGWRSLMSGVVAAALMGGCASMGPPTIPRDRLDYDHAVGESWKRQLLLNLVKIRYGDAPFFLDVASITNSYGLETQVSGGLAWADVVGIGAKTGQSVGAAARYTDKPTITYSPLVGNRFTKSLMTPISPAVVISLLQSGWAADALLRLTVTSVNGVQNRYASGGRARGADPDFYKLIAAMRRVQATGEVGMRMSRLRDQGPEVAVMSLSQERPNAAADADRAEVRRILRINPEANELFIAFGSGQRADNEVAMVTRSMLEMLIDLAGSSVDVPAQDVAEGRVAPMRAFDTDPEGGYVPMIRIHSAKAAPADSFAAIPYHGHWFWIDDRDLPSKSVFSFMLILFSLTDTDSTKTGGPLITIPAG